KRTRLRPVTKPDLVVGQGLKPRRGGLFIGASSPSLPSFCFSAARLWSIGTKLGCGSDLASALRYGLNRATEKQKKEGRVWTFAINRPPLRGLSNGCPPELLSGKDEGLERASTLHALTRSDAGLSPTSRPAGDTFCPRISFGCMSL